MGEKYTPVGESTLWLHLRCYSFKTSLKIRSLAQYPTPSTSCALGHCHSNNQPWLPSPCYAAKPKWTCGYYTAASGRGSCQNGTTRQKTAWPSEHLYHVDVTDLGSGFFTYWICILWRDKGPLNLFLCIPYGLWTNKLEATLKPWENVTQIR